MISVLMTVKNEEKYLKASIQSIINQTYKDWELIIIDDVSTDKTPEIIKGFNDSRIISVRNTEEIGRTRNLNKALVMSTGEYIAYQCADDFSMPKRFEEQIKCFTEGVGIVTTQGIAIDHNGERVGDFYMDEAQWKPKKKIMEVREKDWWVLGASLMFKKECVDKVGPFDDACYFAQDYNIWLRIINHFEFKICRKPLYANRRHPVKDKKNYNKRKDTNWHELALECAKANPIL